MTIQDTAERLICAFWRITHADIQYRRVPEHTAWSDTAYALRTESAKCHQAGHDEAGTVYQDAAWLAHGRAALAQAEAEPA